MALDGVRDACRREIAAGGLTPAAVARLTRDAFGRIDFDGLAPLKKLLKRFFSADEWTDADDAALAALVGPGEGWWRHTLEGGYGLEFGWRGGAFRIELASPSVLLGETFDGPVVPEATPNPRTIRFVTGPIHDGPSRWYETATDIGDPRVARLFAEFDDVANVLVGPDFVAVGLRRPDRWEQLLVPILRAIAVQFGTTTIGAAASEETDTMPGPSARGAVTTPAAEPGGAVQQAWDHLAHLRAGVPADLEEIQAALAAPDAAVRQVAARLLVDADIAVAATAWSELLDDTSRGVRRATVDAMVDAGQPALRPLLERALLDKDGWTRWKALRGLVELGIEPSHAAVEPLAHDPDFRVRLEAAGALHRRPGG